jgi:hypothetical protein
MILRETEGAVYIEDYAFEFGGGVGVGCGRGEGCEAARSRTRGQRTRHVVFARRCASRSSVLKDETREGAKLRGHERVVEWDSVPRLELPHRVI